MGVIGAAVLAEVMVYYFWPVLMGLHGAGLAQISNTPGHHMIIAFLKWVPLPIFLLSIPGLAVFTIVWLWRQPNE
jgi:hypothetical protein